MCKKTTSFPICKLRIFCDDVVCSVSSLTQSRCVPIAHLLRQRRVLRLQTCLITSCGSANPHDCLLTTYAVRQMSADSSLKKRKLDNAKLPDAKGCEAVDGDGDGDGDAQMA